MPKAAPIQTNFNGGELSPKARFRSDIDKYRTTLSSMENLRPTIIGAAEKRPNSYFCAFADSKGTGADDQSRLIPFEYSVSDSYIVVLGHRVATFVNVDGSLVLEGSSISISSITQASPMVISTGSAHGLSVGDMIYLDGTPSSTGDMYQVADRYFVVDSVPTTTSLTVTGYWGTIEDSSIYPSGVSGFTIQKVHSVTTPFDGRDIFDVHYAQSGNVMYLVHPDNPIQKLQRATSTSFTVSEVKFDRPAFMDENLDTAHTMIASATTGVGITLTSSSAFFTNDMVGSYIKLVEVPASKHNSWAPGVSTPTLGTLIRYEGNVYKSTTTGTTGDNPPVHLRGSELDGLSTGSYVTWEYLHSGSGYVEITGFTSSTIVTGDVKATLPDSVAASATDRWAEASWSDERGYPRAVCFYENRLCFGGTDHQPNTLWMSQSDSFEDFTRGELDTDAVIATLSADQANLIQWMSPEKILLVGTTGGEFSVAGATGEPITPASARAVPQTRYGSEHIQPLNIGTSKIFVQRGGKTVREMVQDANSVDETTRVAQDMTVLSEHLFKHPIVQSAYQQEPERTGWFVNSNGDIFCLIYDREQQVMGWYPITFLFETKPVVKSVASISSADSANDRIFALVEFTGDFGTGRAIIYFGGEEETIKLDLIRAGGTKHFVNGVKHSHYGLDHLRGLARSDSEYVVDYLCAVYVSSIGSDDVRAVTDTVTLYTGAFSLVTYELGYNIPVSLSPNPLNAGAADGTSIGRTSRITDLIFGLENTYIRKLEIQGPNYADNTNEVFQYQYVDGIADYDYTGLTPPVDYPGGSSREMTFTLRYEWPFDFVLGSILPIVVTQTDR